MLLSKYTLAWTSTLVGSCLSSVQPLSLKSLAKLKGGLWRWHDHALHCAVMKGNKACLEPQAHQGHGHTQKGHFNKTPRSLVSGHDETINTALINEFTNVSSRNTGSMEIICFTLPVTGMATQLELKARSVQFWVWEDWGCPHTKGILHFSLSHESSPSLLSWCSLTYLKIAGEFVDDGGHHGNNL